MDVGDMVRIKQDPKGRLFKVSGIRHQRKFDGKHYEEGETVATLTLESWGVRWVGMIPLDQLEVQAEPNV